MKAFYTSLSILAAIASIGMMIGAALSILSFDTMGTMQFLGLFLVTFILYSVANTIREEL